MTLTIDTQGHVPDALAWYGPEDAEVEALEAALRWETEPLVVDGAPRAFECPSLWWSTGGGPIRVGASFSPLPCVTAEPVAASVSTGEPPGKIGIVEVVVEPRGTVSRVKVLRSGSVADVVALEAARRMRFGPTFWNGVSVPVIVTVVIPSTGAETPR